LVIVLTTAIVVLLLHFVLQYSMLGKKMRAAADNRDLARISGIRPRETVLTMWVGGGGLAALGGIFLGLFTLVRPLMGFDILLLVFAAVILGGIGSIYGAMLGGFAIGLAHEMTTLLPGLDSEYGAAVAFVIMILILLVRPSGILGRAAT
ncbi:MAG: branched-chain amino acid ABC transporter permease, partial [Halobacteriota archaeon]